MIWKRVSYISVVILIILLNNYVFAGKPLKNNKLNLVVIDAGHGGHDPGAVGLISKEKDIVLSLALRLGKMIESNFSDVKVVYTRKTDEFVELYRRAQIANEIHADLFISLHINSNDSPVPYGFETYVMGLHKSQANLEVAKKENAAILLEDNYKASYDGFDPNSPEASIIFSLYQNAFLDQSLDLSMRIQQQFMKRIKSKDKGVKQAGFLVLYKTAMPAILIESGFLSNPNEEEYINSEKGKSNIVLSIFEAFKEYKYKVEGFNNQSQVYTQKSDDENQNSKSNQNSEVKIKEDTVSINKSEIYFRIQFATSNVEKNIKDKEILEIGVVKVYSHNGLYKYTIGNESSLKDANKLLLKLQEKGFKDAFVVAFLNENRITPAEAVKILKSKQTEKNN
jgi:N-acetylmuramoyl-L-alanine amidase